MIDLHSRLLYRLSLLTPVFLAISFFDISATLLADLIRYEFGAGQMAAFGSDPWGLGSDFATGPAFNGSFVIDDAPVNQTGGGTFDYSLVEFSATIDGTPAFAETSFALARFRNSSPFDSIQIVDLALTFNGIELEFPLTLFFPESDGFDFNSNPSPPPLWTGDKPIQGTSGPLVARVAFEPGVATASVSYVPEPCLLQLALIGLLGLACSRSRKYPVRIL